MDGALEQARRRFVEGVEHFEAGRLEAARKSFEGALELAPDRASVLGNLGITLFHLGRCEDAVPLLRRATAADPDYVEAWQSLGLCLETLSRWAEAGDALEHALNLGSEQAELWMVCGQCHERAGRVNRALDAFGRVLDLDSGAAQAWSARAGVLRDLGRLEEAAEGYERAVAAGADPELHEYYLAAVRGNGGPPMPPRRYVETLFDQYAADFDAHLLDQLQYRGHEWLLHPLITSERRYGQVLDLGCGTGLCGALLAPHADAIDGVDLSGAMIEQARARGVYRELVQDDLTGFLAGIGERLADLVVAADVFIYIGALESVFPAVRNVLAPDGCFAFTVELAPESTGVVLQPSLRYAHSEAYVRRLAHASGFAVREVRRGPLRQDRTTPLDALYVYLE